MKEETRRRLAELLAEEIAHRIRDSIEVRIALESLADLPVEKVVDAFVARFLALLQEELPSETARLITESIDHKKMADAILARTNSILSLDLRDRVIDLLHQDVAAEVGSGEDSAENEGSAGGSAPGQTDVGGDTQVTTESEVGAEDESVSMDEGIEQTVEGGDEPASASLADVLAARALEFDPADWFCLYGFAGGGARSGHSFMAEVTDAKGVDGMNPIIVIRHGSLRLYASRLSHEDHHADKKGNPVTPSKKAELYELEYERIINRLRSDGDLVVYPFWTTVQGIDGLEEYLRVHGEEMLNALHRFTDAREWSIEVLAVDTFLASLESTGTTIRIRERGRDLIQGLSRKIDLKTQEKVLFKEKILAQEIHTKLSAITNESKLKHVVSLDDKFMSEWKPILIADYVVDEEGRTDFFDAIDEMQDELAEFQLRFRLSSPVGEFGGE